MVHDSGVFLVLLFVFRAYVTQRCVPGRENGADTAIQLKCAPLK